MTFDELLREFGLPLAALIFIVVTGARRVWVFGWTYAEVRAERDEWKAVALDLLQVGRKLVDS